MAAAHRLERSLFERLMHTGVQVSILSKQYRMHPEISHFPNKYFYQSMLVDSSDVIERSAPGWLASRLENEDLEEGEMSGGDSWIGR